VNGTIDVMRIEGCFLQGNGMDGMDAVSIDQLIVTGCTITGNGTNMSTGVGIRINRFVRDVELSANTVTGNRYANVYYSTAP
jgi:nitrous oxidase accessory protein NosD